MDRPAARHHLRTGDFCGVAPVKTKNCFFVRLTLTGGAFFLNGGAGG